jgi:hypothetical protein
MACGELLSAGDSVSELPQAASNTAREQRDAACKVVFIDIFDYKEDNNTFFISKRTQKSPDRITGGGFLI